MSAPGSHVYAREKHPNAWLRHKQQNKCTHICQECSANVFQVLERNVHRSGGNRSIQGQMIECNCWRIMSGFTVCPQWADSCVIVTWEVAEEGGWVESFFSQTLDCALHLSAGGNFWSNNFKIEQFDQNGHHCVWREKKVRTCTARRWVPTCRSGRMTRAGQELFNQKTLSHIVLTLLFLMLSTEPVVWLFPDRIWLMLSLLAQKQKLAERLAVCIHIHQLGMQPSRRFFWR